jgi:putative ABC transport system permease protein
VYQILFADISAHLPQYATLKAMGYKNSYLFSVVFQEAIILAVAGYFPGVAVSLWLYNVTERATELPLVLDWQTAVAVLALTIVMCGTAGTIALRKVRSADPAEIF